MTFLSVLPVKIGQNVVKTVKGGQNGEFWSKLRKLVKILKWNLFSRHRRPLIGSEATSNLLVMFLNGYNSAHYCGDHSDCQYHCQDWLPFSSCKKKNYFKSGDSLLISVPSRAKVMNLVSSQCGEWWVLEILWKLAKAGLWPARPSGIVGPSYRWLKNVTSLTRGPNQSPWLKNVTLLTRGPNWPPWLKNVTLLTRVPTDLLDVLKLMEVKPKQSQI